MGASGFMSDQAVAERVLRHVRDRTTDVGDRLWHEPVAGYRDPERFDREVRLLRRTAVPFCPSVALPEPGSWVARIAGGTPLLVVRDAEGRVRAFRNACRHRGASLREPGAGCAKALVCPYHGWTYRLDGALHHVPHESGFPGLDRESHGLAPVRADERLGLVFVTQEEGDPPEPGDDALPELIPPDPILLDSREAEADVNWKIWLEGFIEGYHIRPTHRETFYPFGYDNLNVVEICGRHSRVTYPFRRIEKLATVPAEERRVDGRLTYVYHVFPNALVTVLSHHTNLVVLEPVHPGRTRLVTYAMTNAGRGPEAAAAARRDAGFVNQTGAAEDLAVVLGIQAGLAAEANDVFTFGRFESAIVHFHQNLRRALGERAA
jgi:phenylpropionate dioxygenase-like ring-hydroxylating dioxygenase large terminal subunit